jgi:hypothetical protein
VRLHGPVQVRMSYDDDDDDDDPALQSKRLLIESRWVSKTLAFAGELRPQRLNN